MKAKTPHKPVLLQDILAFFADLRLSTFVDGTVGAGGHAHAILQAHPEITAFIGIDQDPVALEIAKNTLVPWKNKVVFAQDTFSDVDKILDRAGIEKMSGMLLDLGVSSMQLDAGQRGMCFSVDAPLDMRMSPNMDMTAEDILNRWSERELGHVFRDFGEEKRWRAAARAIVQARRKEPIRTTFQLVAVLKDVLKGDPRKKIHPLTLVFQALRICVNRELERLESVIPQAVGRLEKGGRLAVISFHSLEDRIVKEAFRYWASDKENTRGVAGVFRDKEQHVKILTKKPIVPSLEEIAENPRSRSAKLRVVEKIV